VPVVKISLYNRPLRAMVARVAEEIFFFSAEPRKLQRDKRAEKKKIYALMLSKKHSRVIK